MLSENAGLLALMMFPIGGRHMNSVSVSVSIPVSAMPKRPRLRALMAVVITLGLTAAQATGAGTITIGTAGGLNAFPFSAGDYAAGGEYQEIYSSTAFPGPAFLTSIAFVSGTFGQDTAHYDLTLGLSNTTASVAAPSTNFTANKGPNFKTVFSGALTANLLSNGTFDLIFPISLFLYDPSQGNLLLDVVINSVTTGGFNAFRTNATAGLTSRIFQSFGTGPAFTDSTGALFTQFGIPEPSTLPLLALAAVLALRFCFAAATAKRRR